MHAKMSLFHNVITQFVLLSAFITRVMCATASAAMHVLIISVAMLTITRVRGFGHLVKKKKMHG